MTIPHFAPPVLPPPWERANMDLLAREAWATAYGERLADHIETDDRRLGLLPALSAAVRPRRVARGARMALHYWLDADATDRIAGPDPSNGWLAKVS